MGRPLNKKYFGNRNIGSTSTTADDKIGGEGIASVNWSNYGSWRSGAVSGLALPAPTIPGGVQATLSILYSVATVSTSAGKTNLAVGWKGTNASIPGLEVTVTDVSGSNAVFSVTTPATPFATIPFSGNGQGVTFTKSGGTGTAATFLTDINWQVDASTSVGEKGSGYIGTETFTVTTANGTPPAGTIVKTVDTGAVSSATNQENAIICYAKTTTGGTRQIADIIKQVSGTRYKVRTADGVAICKLRTDGGTGTYTMDISAFDTGTAGANEYWVTKLTARNVILVRKGGGAGGTDFVNGKKVKWTFGSAVAPTGTDIGTAIIHNA